MTLLPTSKPSLRISVCPFPLVHLIRVRHQVSRSLLAALILVAAFAACRRSTGYVPVTLLSLPNELRPLSGALDADASSVPDGLIWVRYKLAEPYPARNALGLLRMRLEMRGWQPVAHAWLNPNEPSSHTAGWFEFYDPLHQPPSMVHQWMAEWRSSTGEVVIYDLQYRSPRAEAAPPGSHPDSGQLQVKGELISSSLAEVMAKSGGRGRRNVE